MTTTESLVRNGVDTAALFATINAVDEQRDLARFQFRASNTWMSCTHSRGSISSFYGAGQEMAHMNTWDFDPLPDPILAIASPPTAARCAATTS